MVRTQGPYGVSGSGVMWDDNHHDNLKKITVSYSALGINLVQFEYLDGTETVKGEAHGNFDFAATSIATELAYLAEGEVVTFVTAYTGYAVRKLEFRTNVRIIKMGVDSKVYAEEEAIPFGPFEGDVPIKVVGFHGESGDQFLHKFGVHWAPIQAVGVGGRVNYLRN
ncbi:unnamed protein product [Eruca vesicaria subsp. sativa]|uniref:Jacalin-type lectin domain-containing protein n=1 Tax=Eruca vesicaria subsp. sativa TaxID=29727 RepID=A0ABC8M367_ERUVS|nr:unnamed protein product [Eruca vesicaria subsp. sativa]